MEPALVLVPSVDSDADPAVFLSEDEIKVAVLTTRPQASEDSDHPRVHLRDRVTHLGNTTPSGRITPSPAAGRSKPCWAGLVASADHVPFFVT